MGQLKNLVGQQFGYLTVKARTESDAGRLSKWACLCRCGREIVVRADGLTGGTRRSCGECVSECGLRAIFSEVARGERDATRFSRLRQPGVGRDVRGSVSRRRER